MVQFTISCNYSKLVGELIETMLISMVANIMKLDTV